MKYSNSYLQEVFDKGEDAEAELMLRGAFQEAVDDWIDLGGIDENFILRLEGMTRLLEKFVEIEKDFEERYSKPNVHATITYSPPTQ